MINCVIIGGDIQNRKDEDKPKVKSDFDKHVARRCGNQNLYEDF